LSRRVFLTGAGGFVGSRVAHELVSRGCRVTALVRPSTDRTRLCGLDGKIDVVEGDFGEDTLGEVLAGSGGADVLIHAAWHVEPSTYLRHLGNVEDVSGSLRLFQTARRLGCRRIVGVGTCAEYRLARGYLGETSPLGPETLYGSCKTALYLMASAWARETDTSFAWARLFYLYGPREKPGRIVSSMAASLLAERPFETTAGHQVRDYLYVDDAADAIVTIALSERVGPVNVGSGVPVQVRSLVAAVGRITGRPDLVRMGALRSAPGDPHFVCADTKVLREELGWCPRYSLEEGLAQTIAWWRDAAANERESK
jgi:nucleoside-diphosphate-sugar epimerase